MNMRKVNYLGWYLLLTCPFGSIGASPEGKRDVFDDDFPSKTQQEYKAVNTLKGKSDEELTKTFFIMHDDINYKPPESLLSDLEMIALSTRNNDYNRGVAILILERAGSNAVAIAALKRIASKGIEENGIRVHLARYLFPVQWEVHTNILHKISKMSGVAQIKECMARLPLDFHLDSEYRCAARWWLHDAIEAVASRYAVFSPEKREVILRCYADLIKNGPQDSVFKYLQAVLWLPDITDPKKGGIIRPVIEEVLRDHKYDALEREMAGCILNKMNKTEGAAHAPTNGISDGKSRGKVGPDLEK